MSFEIIVWGIQRDGRVNLEKGLAERVRLFDDSQVHFAG
jgi:hypothetical protein